MIRYAEAAMQIRGQAGEHQVDGARKTLGHAYGGGSQYFSMCPVRQRQAVTRSFRTRKIAAKGPFLL
jgi:hypothetical protein